MSGDEGILSLIRHDRAVAELLVDVCEFDLTRGEHVEPVRLSSGLALEGIAGDFTGGTFFLCGGLSETRPVLYASSERQAGVIGTSLPEALEIMIGLPSWEDCLKFSANGELAAMRAAAGYLQLSELRERAELGARRIQLAAALSLDLAPVPELLARLRDAVSGTAPHFVLTIDSGEEYESLFGPWHPCGLA
jgi:hypothetical protein